MARTSLSAWSGLLTTILLAAPAHAQQPAVPFDAPAPRVARGAAGQPLARATAADRADAVRAYLANAGHAEATITSLVLASRHLAARTGVTHLRFTQRVGDLEVYGTYVKASVDAAGNLTSIIENLAAVRPVATAALAGGEGRALAIGLQHVHGGAPTSPGLVRQQGTTSVFARTAFFHREPTVTRVAVPVGANTLRLGYLVETWTERGNQLHHTLVGSDGTVLGVEARTAQDSYSVFEKDPAKSTQQIVYGPTAAPAAPSPEGWLSTGAQRTTSIQGNNVHAYLDVNADNAADTGGTPVPDGAFTAAWSGAAQPSTQANREVATQNLFFLSNVTHDRLYDHGFDEAAGNFQENNFSKGGLGSDSVLAEVQDGSGTDNANFATPSDGSNPRMQMFVWLGLGNAEVAVGSDEYVAQAAGFGPSPSANGVTAPLVLVNDGAGASASDACERFARGALNGRVAIADRGNCDFTVKVTNAQRAGAVAVIVANNVAGEIFTMGGSASTTIPAVMVTHSDGVVLKGAAGTSSTVRTASPAPINRDSSLDSDIVYHEYGHGLTWRMIGSMSGSMSGAIGEGMSDVLALLFNDAVVDDAEDDVIGEYSSFDANGIRSAPYAGYGRTYGAFSGSGVHFDGEIYAGIGWRLRANFGLDQGTLLDYIVDGMNYTPAGPAFEDMRDGILEAVKAAGSPADHECRVWRAFAAGGVGVGADAVVRRKSVTVNESMLLPAQCQ